MNQIDFNTEKFYEEMGFSPNIKQKIPLGVGEAIKKYKMAHQNIEHWKEVLAECREEIIEASEGESIQFDGLCVTHYEERGRVDYSAIKELENIDLEKYRKSPIMKSRISLN